MAARRGIEFRFFGDIVPGRYYLPEIMGGGVAWVDFDLDGRLDLYAANGRPLVATEADAERVKTVPRQANRFYRQVAGRKFSDVAAASGTEGGDHFGQGIGVGDYDADGFADLYLANYGPNILLRNNGDGTYGDDTAAAGVGDDQWSSSCLWADLDGDDLLDLFVANYMDVAPQTHNVCEYGGKRGYCGPGNHNGVPDRVYLNRGDGTFDDGERLGFGTAAPGKGLALVAGDLDGDLRPEIYVANDMEANFLWIRDASAEGVRYHEVAAASGCAVSGDGLNEASMGVACGDFDGDGLPDLFLTHYYHTKNTLYHNLGGLLFSDQSRRSGVAAATHERLAFGTAAFDVERDGDLDLFTATGHVLGPEQPTFEMEPQLLLNDGSGVFKDAAAAAGPYFRQKMLGRGVAAGDFDDDGDVDLAVSHLDRPLALLENRTPPRGGFVGVKLRTPSRVTAVGGRVRVTAGERSWTAPVLAGGSYLSNHDDRLLFGLGDEAGPVKVEVFWPSGQVTKAEGLAANAYHVIDAPAAAAATTAIAEGPADDH